MKMALVALKKMAYAWLEGDWSTGKIVLESKS